MEASLVKWCLINSQNLGDSFHKLELQLVGFSKVFLLYGIPEMSKAQYTQIL